MLGTGHDRIVLWPLALHLGTTKPGELTQWAVESIYGSHFCNRTTSEWLQTTEAHPAKHHLNASPVQLSLLAGSPKFPWPSQYHPTQGKCDTQKIRVDLGSSLNNLQLKHLTSAKMVTRAHDHVNTLLGPSQGLGRCLCKGVALRLNSSACVV